MWDYGADNRGPEMAAVSLVMAAVSVIAVALRSYTMTKLLKRFLFEDLLAVITCILQCGFCVLVVVGVSYGLGAHVDNVPEENRPKALIFKWAGQVAYIVVSTLVKFVVGIFLLRLCVNNNWQRITIIVLLVIVGLFNIFYVFLAIFQCQPVEFYWYRYDSNAPVTGKCNGHALATIPTYFAVLIGIASDLTLALLPATLIKGANLDRRTKISVCCVLALGSLASVATIARIPYAKQLLSDPDYLYNFTDLAIWSIVECGIAITASSLATLRPLFVKMKLLASAHFTSRYNYPGNMDSAGLPMQSARTVTVVSSRHAKRNTAMTGTTAMTGSTAVTGAGAGLIGGKVYQDGIQVEKEFEMSIITRENSEDSIDRLEAEINEVIRPGTAKRKASQDRYSSRANSLTPRPRPAPLQTSFEDAAVMSAETITTISAGSSNSGPRHPYHTSNTHTPTSSTSQRLKRFSNGLIRSNSFSQAPRTPSSSHDGIGSALTDTIIRPPPPSALNNNNNSQAPLPMHGRHQHSYSVDTINTRQTPGGTPFSPPVSFHLPTTRMHHQSGMSTQSAVSTATSPHSRRTTPGESRQSGAEGLTAPPRLTQTPTGDFMIPSTSAMHINTSNINNKAITSPLGSPVNLITRFSNRSITNTTTTTNGAAATGSSGNSSPATPTTASPVSGVRFPFRRPGATSNDMAAPITYYNNTATPPLAATAATSSLSSSFRNQQQQQQQQRGGKQRVSAFLADNSSTSTVDIEHDAGGGNGGYGCYGSSGIDILEEGRVEERPLWTAGQRSSDGLIREEEDDSPLSPLRSHPMSSSHASSHPGHNWV